MAKLKYACIGAGGIARKKHVAGYAKQKDVEIVAICDTYEPSAKKLAADFGVAGVYTDYQKMLEECKPDIVSVCTPNCTHAEITIACLRAGANVHVEKPIAMNAQEAEAIVAAEAETGKQVMLGLNKRFLGVTQLIHRLMDEGFFGDIYKATCGWERDSGIPGIGRWFTNKALSGGGALIDLGVHYLDLTLDLMGWPEAESVSGNIFTNYGKGAERIRRGYASDPDGVYDVEDSATGFVRMKNGAMLDFTFSWASNIKKEVRHVTILGTKGGLSLVDDKLELYAQYGGSMFTLTPDEATVPLDTDECGYFVSCLQTGKKVSTPATEGLKMMKIIDGLYESAETHREVLI